MEYWVEEATRAEESERGPLCSLGQGGPHGGAGLGEGSEQILKGMHGQRLTRGPKSRF